MLLKLRNKYLKNTDILVTMLVFIFFLTIFVLAPIGSDDWGNYIIGMEGPKNWLDRAISMYFTWEGRLVSRFLINMLTHNKWLWNIFNALSMSILFYMSLRLINSSKKVLVSLFLFLGILLIGKDIFAQTYLWVAGNITYFLPLVLLVAYFYLIKKYLDNSLNNKYVYGIWFVLNMIIPMIVETAGLVIVVTNLILLIYLLIKKKKINYLFLTSLIIALIPLIIMLKSPGTEARMLYENSLVPETSMFSQIINNIPNFINYSIAGNIIILVLTPISFIYLVWKTTNNKYIRMITVLFNVIPYITIIYNILNLATLSSFSSLLRSISFLSTSNIYIIIYWIIYLIALFVLILIRFRKNHQVIFFFVIGLIANGAMLISPVWGPRTTLFTVYMILLTNLFIISEIPIKMNYEMLIKNITKVFTVIIVLIYLILYLNVNKQYKIRNESIKKQIENGSQKIIIEQIPDYTLWGINPVDEYHVETFKEYYHIPKNNQLIIQPTKYKYFLFYNHS